MNQPVKIVIVGNGFGGIYTLKNLRRIFGKNKGIKLSLVGEKNYFLFTPLLHEVATGGINPSNIIEPIRKVLGFCLDQFYLGKVEKINIQDHTVKVENNLIPYDYLVLATGAETNFYGIPGAEKYSFSLKSIEDAVKIKNHIIMQMEHAAHTVDREQRKNMLRFVVVGGGPTGVELAAEIEELVRETFAHFYRKEIIEDISIILIQKDGELVPQFGTKIRKKSLHVLMKKGIEVMLNTGVNEVGESFVTTDKGKIMTETIVWVAGIKPIELNFDQEIPRIAGGKIPINEYLQVENHPEIFALGDMAAFKDKNGILPALAQVAQKQAKVAAKNIQSLIKNKPLKTFVYHSYGNLMSIGHWMAVGEVPIFSSFFSFSGRITWWVWRTVYLSKLISWRKKVRVATDWTINLFSPRDISQL